MTGMLLSSSGLTEAEQSLTAQIEEMQRNATMMIQQRAAKVEEYLSETKLRYLKARTALSSSLASLANSVSLRWSRLSVTSFHGRLGKCCCASKTNCEWQAWKLGGPEVDYECKLGFNDYLDLLSFDVRGAEGVALSKTTAVDVVLDQCAKKGWPYPSIDWSPPEALLHPPTVVIDHPLPLVDSDSQPIEVQVPEVVKAKDGDSQTPALDVDLETETD